MFRLLCIMSCIVLLAGCATNSSVVAELKQGQRYFETGYYKKAMRALLPLASDGNAPSQYAVGYMYYYGYGTTMDQQLGFIWIKRAADQQYPPAVRALSMIKK